MHHAHQTRRTPPIGQANGLSPLGVPFVCLPPSCGTYKIATRPHRSGYSSTIRRTMNTALFAFLCALLVMAQQHSSAVQAYRPARRSGGACAKPSITTASGRSAPAGPLCVDQLIFEENFDELNANTWQKETNIWGGGVSRSVVFFRLVKSVAIFIYVFCVCCLAIVRLER